MHYNSLHALNEVQQPKRTNKMKITEIIAGLFLAFMVYILFVFLLSGGGM
jgi:hypothetical protein